MNNEYQEWLKKKQQTITSFWIGCAPDNETKQAFFLEKLRVATSSSDEDVIDDLVDIAIEVVDCELKIPLLNRLLLNNKHQRHQEVTREIQLLADPSSINFIDMVLDNKFKGLEYTGSEDEVIAKWFSHALYDIKTQEAIDTIRKHAKSSVEGIRKEMQYRLKKVEA